MSEKAALFLDAEKDRVGIQLKSNWISSSFSTLGSFLVRFLDMPQYRFQNYSNLHWNTVPVFCILIGLYIL